MAEKHFRQAIIQLAKLLGWECFFAWNSLHSPAGWPDLFLVRNDVIVAWELKVGKNKVTEAQQHWLDVLNATGKIEARVVRDSEWDFIEEVLR